MKLCRALAYWSLVLVVAGCAGTDDLLGVAAKPPLDCAVLVSGGAFFAPIAGAAGTFLLSDEEAAAEGQVLAPVSPDAAAEAISFEVIVDVLQRGRVFQRVVADPDVQRRSELRKKLHDRDPSGGLREFLHQASEDGFDLLLLVEELRDGPIETQGTNNRWPVTFATWILLGVGALIPDRTFESRATLRVSLRELQTGRALHTILLDPGPVDLALTERTDLLGLLLSVVVPPFWVGDDREAVADSVRAITERRLLVRLARDLKSEVLRRQLGDAGAADIELVAGQTGPRVTISSRESLSGVRLLGPGFADDSAVQAFERELLASRRIQGVRFLYEARLPSVQSDRAFQVKVGTLRGGVSSATFTLESAR